MLNIRLARTGRKRDAHFRVVVSDSAHGRVGRILETVGYYHPRLPNDAEGRLFIDRDRARYWLGHGARPSPTVRSFLRRMPPEQVGPEQDATVPEAAPDRGPGSASPSDSGADSGADSSAAPAATTPAAAPESPRPA